MGVGIKSTLGSIDSLVGVHGAVLVGQHHDVYLLLVIASVNCHLLWHEAWSMYIEARSKGRNLYVESTVSTRHGCIAFVAQHTELNTCQWLVRHLVYDGTADGHHRIFVICNGTLAFWLLDAHFNLLVLVICLGECGGTEAEGHCAE